MSTLSLLSRGNAQVVKTSQEKLVVRYEPEDYFNWKSHQDFDIRRFLSGRCASIHYWAVPTHKTYSTRKGALVLYSEDLALPAWHESQDRRVKRRQRYKRKSYQTELSTLQDLTGAILSYGRKQKDQTEPYWQPYLHFLNKEDVQCRRQIRPGYSPKRYLTRLFQTWDPNTVYKLQQAGSLRDSVQLQKLTASVDSGGRHPDLSSTPLKYNRLPVFTCLPYWSNTDVFTSPGNCTPLEEEAENEELAYDKEILEIYGKNSIIPSTAALRKSSPEAKESYVTKSSWKAKEQSNSHMGEAQQNQSSGDGTISFMIDRHEKPPAPVDVSCLKENSAFDYGKPHMTFYGGPFAGQRKHPHSKQHKDYVEHLSEGGFLPPISQAPTAEVLKDPITKVQESLKLPRIIEEPSKIPQRKRRRHATDPPKELLVIPLLVRFENQKVNQEEQTGMEEITKNGIYNSSNNEEPAGSKSKSEEDLKEEQMDPPPTSDVPIAAAESRFKTLQMDIDWNLDPNTGGDLPAPEAPPLGSLPPINGKKGRGNQSSMSNLKAANATSSASAINPKGLPTGIIRGSLPEELKECCKGSSVGSLIMGPDGEIVCLSLMGATRDADIPIRFDFIPEEEEDCLPVESAGQEEQWSGSQQDSEKERDSYNPPSLRDSSGSSERVSTPPYRKGKKGKRKNPNSESSLQGEGTEVSVQELEQHRFSEKTHKGHKKDVSSGMKKDKLNKLTEEESDQRGEERNSRTRSPEQESEHYSAENGSEDGDEASSTSVDDFQDQYIEEEGTPDQNMQPSQQYIQPPKSPYSQPQDLTPFNKAPIQAEASSRSTSDKEQLDSATLVLEQGSSSYAYTDKLNNKRHSVLTRKDYHKSGQEKENERGEQQIEKKHGTEQRTKKEGHHPLPDATNIRPRLMEEISHVESASSEPDSSQESADSDPAAPSTGQDPNHSQTSGQVIKDSGKQPKLKSKTSEVTKAHNPKPNDKNGNNPEIFKDVEKVSFERKENVPVTPQQTEVKQENSCTDEKPQLTEEEELELLQETTSAVAKDTTKLKGKKKAKNEKAQKPEKAQASSAKKVNQKAGAEQGKAAFVVGKPKNKKGESNNSYRRKPSIQVMVEDTIHETQESSEEIQEEEENDSEKSEDSYVVIEYDERTPTPTQSKDIYPESPTSHNEISGQTDDNQVTATLEVTSQANEDDYSYSETSEVTSSSIRQRRSSRAHEISEKAERRRLEVERKRREREEQLRLEKEQQERLDKMKEELEQEQLRRAEEIRLRKKQEEEERQRQEQERACKMQLEQQALERARQQQEEHRHKLQEIQRRKQQEEMARIEMERQRQREQERLEAEERLRLLDMAAEEREEYQRKKREREEQARQEAEERKRKADEEAKAIMEEALRQAQLLAKQTAALEQQLQFNRGLLKESVGMDQTQGISRPWVFSYFEFLELLGMPLPVEGE